MSPGDGELIRQAVLRWLVARGEPLRVQPMRFTPGGRGRKAKLEPSADWTRDVLERLGAVMHLNGHREMLSVKSPARAHSIFERWMEGVPDGGCELMFERMTWEDSSWTLYSSFDESCVTERGVDMQVFCRCGRVAGVVWRYEGTWGDLLRGITEDEGNRK